MSTYIRFGLAAAAVVLAAVIGIALYGNSVGGPPDATASPTLSSEASPSSTPAADVLRGQWATPETTCAEQNAAVEAAGITAEQMATATGGWNSTDCAGMTHGSRFVIRFDRGTLSVYQDGEEGWHGRYRIVDEDTFEAGDDATFYITYQYAIVGDQLTFDMISNSCPDSICASEADRAGELIAQTVIYETSPFTFEP